MSAGAGAGVGDAAPPPPPDSFVHASKWRVLLLAIVLNRSEAVDVTGLTDGSMPPLSRRWWQWRSWHGAAVQYWSPALGGSLIGNTIDTICGPYLPVGVDRRLVNSGRLADQGRLVQMGSNGHLELNSNSLSSATPTELGQLAELGWDRRRELVRIEEEAIADQGR